MSKRKPTLKKDEVEQEDKKPPISDEPLQKPQYPDITTEQEKELYEGQEHIEENSQNQSIASKEVVTENQNLDENAKIVTKPRETYLQEKLSKLNCNKKLMTNIKKELNDQIKTMVDEDNVLITEVPRDLNKYIKKQSENNNLKIAFSDFTSKQKYKQLKTLKEEQNILKNNLKQVEQNEKLLQDEGFMNLNNSGKGYAPDSMFEKAIKEQQLKAVTQKKNRIIEKIKDIEMKIYNIIGEDQKLSNKEKRKLFIDNFERDREIAEVRAKKYLKESKERDQRMKNDINQIVEKRKKEIEEKDKEEKMKKQAIIQKFKEKEKALELRHSKKNNEIMEKYKPFRNKNLDKKSKDYNYSKIYEKFKKDEEHKFKQANLKRHQEVDSVNLENIYEFSKQVDKKIEKDEIEREQKWVEKSRNWKKNKDSLPQSNYVVTVAEEENIKKEEEEKKKKEKYSAFVLEKKNYGEMIREKYAPEIDTNLKKVRENIITALEDPGSHKKYTMNKQKKKRVILKKRDDSKPSKFKWELKIEEPKVDQFEDQTKNIVKKPRRVNLSPITRTKSLVPGKRPDYLREIINKKEVRNRAMSTKKSEGNNDNEAAKNDDKGKKWEKAINNDNATLLENINNVKVKANSLEKEAEMKEKLLKLNGGIENNPELGKKVSSLLIDSIKAKLSKLKKVIIKKNSFFYI
jgi:hypothetical protein